MYHLVLMNFRKNVHCVSPGGEIQCFASIKGWSWGLEPLTSINACIKRWSWGLEPLTSSTKSCNQSTRSARDLSLLSFFFCRILHVGHAQRIDHGRHALFSCMIRNDQKYYELHPCWSHTRPCWMLPAQPAQSWSHLIPDRMTDIKTVFWRKQSLCNHNITKTD